MKKGLKSHSKEKEEKTPVNFSQCAHFFFFFIFFSLEKEGMFGTVAIFA